MSVRVKVSQGHGPDKHLHDDRSRARRQWDARCMRKEDRLRGQKRDKSSH
jgi:hypothetical protein